MKNLSKWRTPQFNKFNRTKINRINGFSGNSMPSAILIKIVDLIPKHYHFVKMFSNQNQTDRRILMSCFFNKDETIDENTNVNFDLNLNLDKYNTNTSINSILILLIQDLNNNTRILSSSLTPTNLNINKLDFNNQLLPLTFQYKFPFWTSIRSGKIGQKSVKDWLKYNEPGIYVIECSANKRKYFGETTNIKHRFQSTYSSLKRGIYSSKLLQRDWNKYKSSNFVFKIIYQGEDWKSKPIRRIKEAILVQENKLNVYNNVSKYNVSKLSEKINCDLSVLNQIQPINEILNWIESEPTLITKSAPSIAKIYAKPGIYGIICFATKRIYFGETTNLADRYEYTRKTLHNGKYSNKQLLNDFQKYGINSFLFVPLYYGSSWNKTNIRKQAEKFLIGLNNRSVYNTQHTIKIKSQLNDLNEWLNKSDKYNELLKLICNSDKSNDLNDLSDKSNDLSDKSNDLKNLKDLSEQINKSNLSNNNNIITDNNNQKEYLSKENNMPNKSKKTFNPLSKSPKNGLAISVYVEGKIYPSISNLKKIYKLSSIEVKKRLDDNQNYPEWQYFNKKTETQFADFPNQLYLISNKVFKSQRSIAGLKEFGNLSPPGVTNRFKSNKFPDWRSVKLEEFIELSKNQNFIIMWQRPNDHPEKE